MKKFHFFVASALTIAALYSCKSTGDGAEPLLDVLPFENAVGEYVYVNTSNGNKVGEVSFVEASAFFGDYAIVREDDGRLHLINRQLKNVGDAYGQITYMNDGIALVVSPHGHISAISDNGKELFKLDGVESASAFSGGLAMFRNQKGYCGLIDKSGKVVLEADTYRNMSAPTGGLMAVSLKPKGGKSSGVINTEGEVIVPCKYESTSLFRTDAGKIYVVCELNGQKGVYDGTGKKVLEIKYSDVICLPNGNFLVSYYKPSKDATLWGMVDEKGDVLMDNKFQELGIPSGSGIIPALKGDSWGLLDMKGRWLVRPDYTSIEPGADNQFITVDRDYLYGLIDDSGEWVLNSEFSQISYLGNGNYIVEDDSGSAGLYNKDGKKLSELGNYVFSQQCLDAGAFSSVHDEFLDIDKIMAEMAEQIDVLKISPMTIEKLRNRFNVFLSCHGSEILCENHASCFTSTIYADVWTQSGYDFYKGDYTDYYITSFKISFDLTGKADGCEKELYEEFVKKYSADSDSGKFSYPGFEKFTLSINPDLSITLVPNAKIR